MKHFTLKSLAIYLSAIFLIALAAPHLIAAATTVLNIGTQRPAMPTIVAEAAADCGIASLTVTESSNTDPKKRPQGYNIYRSKQGEGNFTLIASNASPSTFADNTPTAGKYVYKVAAYNTLGESPMSPVSAVNTNQTGCLPKSIPVTCAVTNKPENLAVGKDISWKATITDATKAPITYQWNDGKNSFANTIGNKAFKYNEPGTVTMNLTVSDSSGRSGTAVCSADIKGAAAKAPEKPAAPVVTRVTTACDSDLTVSWTSVSAATGYDLYRHTITTQKEKISSNIQGTTYTEKASTLKTGPVYQYEVVALNGALQSPISFSSVGMTRPPVCTGTTPPVTTPPVVLAAPTNLKAVTSDVCGARTRLTWSSVAGAAGYNVYRSASPDGTYLKIADNYGLLDFTDIGATNLASTTYYYRVFAANGSSESRLYASGNAKTSGDCAAPPVNVDAPSKPALNSTVSSTCGGSIAMNWDYQENVSYKIYLKFTTNGAYELIGNTPESSFEFSSTRLSPSTTYVYKVVPVKAGYEYDDQSSSAITVSSEACKPLPVAPSTFTAAPGATCDDGVKLTWSKSNNAKGYYIYVATSTTSDFYYLRDYSTTSAATTITYNDMTATPGTLVYKIFAYSDYSSMSPEKLSNTITQPDCDVQEYDPENPDDGEPSDTTFPSFSLFTAKYISAELAAATGNALTYGAGSNVYLIYSLNPEHPENYVKVPMRGNNFFDDEDAYSYGYFPTSPPNIDPSLYETGRMQVLTDTGLKNIAAYRLKDPTTGTPGEVGPYPEGIDSVQLDLPISYEPIPDYIPKEDYVAMGGDEAFRFEDLEGSIMTGQLNVYSRATRDLTPEEMKDWTEHPETFKATNWKEIKTADIDFSSAFSRNWGNGGMYSNNNETPRGSGNSGVTVTRYGCDGATNHDASFQISWTWLGYQNIDNGDGSITTPLEVGSYGSDMNRGGCRNDAFPYNYSYGGLGTSIYASYKNPVPFYKVHIQDSDGVEIKTIQMWGEGDPDTVGGNYRVSGDLTVKMTKFNTHNGMFDLDRLLGSDPDYTVSASEANYIDTSVSWIQNVYNRVSKNVKFNPVTASVTSAFNKVSQITRYIAGFGKESQTAKVYKKSKKKSKPGLVARNLPGNPPKPTKQKVIQPAIYGTPISMDSEYFVRSIMDRELTKANQKGDYINKDPCRFIGQKSCTTVTGLSISFIHNLAKWRKSLNEDILINGGTEYWLHNIRNTWARRLNRATNASSHGFPMTVDINKQGGIVSKVTKYPKVSGCNLSIYRYTDAASGFTLRFYNEDNKHFHAEGYPDSALGSPCAFSKSNLK